MKATPQMQLIGPSKTKGALWLQAPVLRVSARMFFLQKTLEKADVPLKSCESAAFRVVDGQYLLDSRFSAAGPPVACKSIYTARV